MFSDQDTVITIANSIHSVKLQFLLRKLGLSVSSIIDQELSPRLEHLVAKPGSPNSACLFLFQAAWL
jgi:hypothetical protein